MGMHIGVSRWKTSLLLAVLLMTLSGCGVRPISNSGYPEGRGASNPFYKGELTEFDVLGISLQHAIAEDEIAQSFSARQRITLRKGAPVMVVQSGAPIPDEPMVQALARHFDVAVFSGVPLWSERTYGWRYEGEAPKKYALALRLAAAKGGDEKIVCYWGMLETAQTNFVTKTVSWVPVVGWVLPDESQHMRIRLKVAVVDVRNGSWDIFSPTPFDDTSMSGRLTRAGSDQEQVALLKGKAYEAAVEGLVKRYVQ